MDDVSIRQVEIMWNSTFKPNDGEMDKANEEHVVCQ
jgi:hypothetical protein